MSGVHHSGRSSGPIGLPRATSRASQSRMGRQTGPAGAAQRMVSQPAYVSNPRDVSGAGRLLTPRDRLAVETRNASADQASPARRFVTPIAAPGVVPNALTSAAPLQRVPFYNRPSQSNSPFQSHAHLTTTVGRALTARPVLFWSAEVWLVQCPPARGSPARGSPVRARRFEPRRLGARRISAAGPTRRRTAEHRLDVSCFSYFSGPLASEEASDGTARAGHVLAVPACSLPPVTVWLVTPDLAVADWRSAPRPRQIFRPVCQTVPFPAQL